MTSNLTTLCKNEFHVQILRTAHILLIQSFPNPHRSEIRPPSSRPGGKREPWILATMAIADRTGVSFPSSCPGGGSKALVPSGMFSGRTGWRCDVCSDNKGSRRGTGNGSRESTIFPTLATERHLSMSKPPMTFYELRNPNSSDGISGFLSQALTFLACSPTRYLWDQSKSSHNSHCCPNTSHRPHTMSVLIQCLLPSLCSRPALLVPLCPLLKSYQPPKANAPRKPPKEN